MPLPLVTAVIPLHNHAEWVMDAVRSVATQDYPRKRIVVVDDGSTDGGHLRVLTSLDEVGTDQPNSWAGTLWVTPEKGVSVYLVRYPEARGPSFARNRGMEALPAEGQDDLFAFLDSDDVYEPGKIARSVAEFAKAPGVVGAVYTDFDTVNPDGLRLRQFKEPFCRQRLMQECLPNCDSLVSVRAIVKCDGFDEDLRVAEDYDLWMRISEHFLITHIPESLVTIRVGPHSSSATVKNEVWQQNWRRVMAKAQQRATARPQA